MSLKALRHATRESPDVSGETPSTRTGTQRRVALKPEPRYRRLIGPRR